MQKIVINACHGGFGLSKKAFEFLECSARTYSLSRDDPKLIECVETLGKDANGDFAKLVIIEIPDGIEWQIEEYDGSEWVSGKHRAWGAGGPLTLGIEG